MRKSAACILAKRIVGVVRRDGTREPRSQLFLLFDDGTHFEFYGQIHLAGGLDRGGVAAIRRAFPEGLEDPQPEVTEEILTPQDRP